MDAGVGLYNRKPFESKPIAGVLKAPNFPAFAVRLMQVSIGISVIVKLEVFRIPKKFLIRKVKSHIAQKSNFCQRARVIKGC